MMYISNQLYTAQYSCVWYHATQLSSLQVDWLACADNTLSKFSDYINAARCVPGCVPKTLMLWWDRWPVRNRLTKNENEVQKRKIRSSMGSGGRILTRWRYITLENELLDIVELILKKHMRKLICVIIAIAVFLVHVDFQSMLLVFVSHIKPY